MRWMKVAERPRGVAIANFEDSGLHRLRLTIGDVVCIEQQTVNWYRGFNVNNRAVRGIFPRCCVSVQTIERSSSEHEDSTPFLTELTATIHEYSRIANDRFVKGDRETFESIRRTVFELVQVRRIVLTGKLAEAEKRSRMLDAARKIDRMNRLLKLDLVIRDEQLGLLRTSECGLVGLYRRHVAASKRHAGTTANDRSTPAGGSEPSLDTSMNASDRQRDAEANGVGATHTSATVAFGVQLTVKNLICDLRRVGNVEVSLFIADANYHPITERYTFKWPPARIPAGSASGVDLPLHALLFREFGADDMQREGVQLICLVATCFYEAEKPADADYFRRTESAWKVPYACGALDLTSIFRKPGATVTTASATQNGPTNPASGSLFDDAEQERAPDQQFGLCAVEKDELYIDALQKRRTEGTGRTLTFSLRRVELGPGFKTQNATTVRALRFADAIAAGGDDEERNDFYVTLKQGEFARGGKKADRNVEVTVSVLMPTTPTGSGSDAPATPPFREYELAASANGALSRAYRTVAVYHQNAPRWLDTLRVALPATNTALANAHLRFVMRHRSSNIKTDREGPFAIAYLRLQRENGTIQPDDTHKLAVYRIDGRLDDSNVSYLSLPSTFQPNQQKLPPAAAGGASLQPSRDWLEVSTLLTSKLFTQDESLLGVLSWQRLIDRQPTELLRHIRNLALPAAGNVSQQPRRAAMLSATSKRGSDLLKFLDSVLEALFGILNKLGDSERPNRVEFEQAVFDALVRVLLFVTHAGCTPLLDKYVDERFSMTRAHVVLIELLTAYINYAVHLESALTDPVVEAHPAYWPKHLTVSASSSATGSTGASRSGADRNALLVAYKEPLENMIKCLRPLLRFIARSRAADEALLSGIAARATRFDQALLSFFEQTRLFVARAMDRSAPLLFQLLKALPDALEVLCELQPRENVATFFVAIIDAVPTRISCVQYVLFALQKVVSGALFKFADCRAVLLPKVCAYVNDQLLGELASASVSFRGEQVRQCADILLSAFDALHNLAREGGETQADLAHMASTLLRTLACAVHSVDRVERAPANPLKQGLTTALLSLLHQLTDNQLSALFDADAYHELVCLHDLLLELLNVITDLLNEVPAPDAGTAIGVSRLPAFASDWFEMSLAQASILQRVLVMVALKMRERLAAPDIPAIEYEYQIDCWYAVWMRFFETSFAFITQRCVSVERFSAAKRDSVLSRYGDMRVPIAEQVESLWFSLDEHKKRFMPQILPTYLRMTLACSSQALRRRSMRVLFDMFAFERRLLKSLKRAEHEFITALDRFLELGLGDEQYRDVFDSEMRTLVAACAPGDNPFAYEQPDLVTMSVQLMGNLLQYRRVTTLMDETLFDVRMLAIVSLLSVYDTLKRDELYNRYVLKLTELHEACSNYVEQGFALLVLANKLEWSTQPLPNSHACLLQDEAKAAAWLRLPVSANVEGGVAQRDVKFALLARVYECFRSGKLWEQAIAVLKQLIRHCERQLFDYSQLSTLLNKQAECYANIINDKMRYSPPLHYYKVGFYGKDFFPFLSNREFIYRGEPTELIGTLLERIKLQFPAAEQLHGQPNQSHKDSNRQYLSILPVEPQPYVVGDDKLQIDEQILEYYSMNELQSFSTKDVLAIEPRKADDVINLWMESVEMLTGSLTPVDAAVTNNRAMESTVKLTEYVRINAEADRDGAEVRVDLARFPTIVRWLPIRDTRRTLVTPVQNAINAVRGQHRQLVKATARFVERRDKSEVQSLLRIVSGLIDAAVNGGLQKYNPFFKDEYLENPQNEAQAKFIPEFCNVIADVSTASYNALVALGDQLALLGEMRDKFDYLIGSFQDFVANIERDFGVKLPEKEQKLATLKLRSGTSSGLKNASLSTQNLTQSQFGGSSSTLPTKKQSANSSANLLGASMSTIDSRPPDKPPAPQTLQRHQTIISNAPASASRPSAVGLKDETDAGSGTGTMLPRHNTVRKAISSTMQTLFKSKQEAPSSPAVSKQSEMALGPAFQEIAETNENNRRSGVSFDSTASSGASLDDLQKAVDNAYVSAPQVAEKSHSTLLSSHSMPGALRSAGSTSTLPPPPPPERMAARPAAPHPQSHASTHSHRPPPALPTGSPLAATSVSHSSPTAAAAGDQPESAPPRPPRSGVRKSGPSAVESESSAPPPPPSDSRPV